MKNKFFKSKIVINFILGVLISSFVPTANCISIEKSDENERIEISSPKKFIENEKKEIDSEDLLRYWILSKDINKPELVLTKDLYIKNKLAIESNLTIDLNKHKLIFENPDVQILIGKKISFKVPYQVKHKGHFEKRTKETRYYDEHNKKYITKKEDYDVWIPEYESTEYEERYRYDDNVRVNIMNGFIEGANGKKVEDQKSAYWFWEAYGDDGCTPAEVFNLVSGQLNLKNVQVVAGNGSNGGNATYSALWHIPLIGGGDGGDGGNGGNGGSIFFADHGMVISRNSNFFPGQGGIGGKGSRPNPNYWLWSGGYGENGKDGKRGKIINESSALLQIE